MFNIFKKKTMSGKVEPIDPWPPPPEDGWAGGLPTFPENLIPMPKVKPPKEEPEEEKESYVESLIKATEENVISWVWDIENQRYYTTFTSEYNARMFTIKSEWDKCKPVEEVVLKYIADGIVTVCKDHPDVNSLYHLIRDMAIKEHDRHSDIDIKSVEEKLQKVKEKKKWLEAYIQ
jgi:hypothetical protein